MGAWEWDWDVAVAAVGDWGLGGVRALIGDGRGGFGLVWWFEWFVSGGIGGEDEVSEGLFVVSVLSVLGIVCELCSVDVVKMVSS